MGSVARQNHGKIKQPESKQGQMNLQAALIRLARAQELLSTAADEVPETVCS